jgi:hypothetical protein
VESLTSQMPLSPRSPLKLQQLRLMPPIEEGTLLKTLAQLEGVTDDVNIFIHPDECVDFFTDIEDIKVFLTVDGSLV